MRKSDMERLGVEPVELVKSFAYFNHVLRNGERVRDRDSRQFHFGTTGAQAVRPNYRIIYAKTGRSQDFNGS